MYISLFASPSFADYQGTWTCSAWNAHNTAGQQIAYEYACITYTGQRSSQLVRKSQVTAKCETRAGCDNGKAHDCYTSLPQVTCTGTIRGNPEDQTASGWGEDHYSDYYFIPSGDPIDPPPIPAPACKMQDVTIDYKELSPSEFDGAQKSASSALSCDADATITIDAVPPSFSLTNGASASVDINGSETYTTKVAGGASKDLTITSTLHGTSVEIGDFQGSTTLRITAE